ncbi:MAG: apolipoprotein N-acyltransferase [Chitinivibrionales bacterium]|nr:apolipoprotein N-acyltransferase [Chitinivibrionales bacterium]
MLQIIKNIRTWYTAKNRWWIPLLTGFSYALCLPPFNHTLHFGFALFPLLSGIILLPLFGFASQMTGRRWAVHCYLYGVTASLSQFYWFANVVAEGLWHLILMGLAAAALFMGLFYLLAGFLFRFLQNRFPDAILLFFPATWVCLEYLRSVGEIAFPWALLGYAWTPVLPIAQAASVAGVFGFSFVVVLVNVVVWKWLQHLSAMRRSPYLMRLTATLVMIIAFECIWGWLRMSFATQPDKDVTVSLVQSDVNQNQWGNKSLDTSFAIAETLVYQAAQAQPDVIILPESALLCYLLRRPKLTHRVYTWMDSVKAPLILGALHWDRSPKDSPYNYLVYNAALMLKPQSRFFDKYYKIKLVPFSEAMPFEGILPILSRVNLGEADFQRGNEHTIFSFPPHAKGAPLICYEIIFPGYVRKRIRAGANLLVNITNDGWFGRSTAPYQHAVMAQMRCIENGTSLVRCANSGISMMVDQFGRVLGKTDLYERTILTGRVSARRIRTLYNRIGDWPAWVSLILVLYAFTAGIVRSSASSSRSK